MTLYEKTRELLLKCPRDLTYKDISNHLNVSEGWVKTFATGETKNPGVNTVQKLYELLTNRRLIF